MNDIIARGAGVAIQLPYEARAKKFPAGKAHADDEDDAWSEAQSTFKRLTPEEANVVRRRNPPVSPWRVVAMQIVAGTICVVAALAFLPHPSAAWSAGYGAAAAVLPNALMARGMSRRTTSAVAAAAGFMFWEMLKIGTAIAMLAIAAKVVPNLNWPVLLATMVVCIKMNWFALRWRGRTNGRVSGIEHGN